MPRESASQIYPTEVAEAIERQIVQRTWGRIHRLQVELIEDRVIVHGCTSTYYSKLLAVEGVLDVLGSSDSARVDLDIQVAASPHISMNGRYSRLHSASE